MARLTLPRAGAVYARRQFRVVPVRAAADGVSDAAARLRGARVLAFAAEPFCEEVDEAAQLRRDVAAADIDGVQRDVGWRRVDVEDLQTSRSDVRTDDPIGQNGDANAGQHGVVGQGRVVGTHCRAGAGRAHERELVRAEIARDDEIEPGEPRSAGRDALARQIVGRRDGVEGNEADQPREQRRDEDRDWPAAPDRGLRSPDRPSGFPV